MTEQKSEDKSIFGFWVYLMTDLILFAALFAAFATLRNSNFGGPTASQLLDVNNALAETLILLTSSFTCGLALLAAERNNRGWTIGWLGATFALGGAFLTLELAEFSKFLAQGASWQTSGFLSSFFTLVGTHGLHISIGLLWIVVALFQIGFRGLSPFVVSKLKRFALFWHFLDIVWIFIFTIVYLMSHV
jgi:cytochrome o ubiquinol oxidase subunit 3